MRRQHSYLLDVQGLYVWGLQHAWERSASSQTMKASLPPSSSTTGVSVAAAADSTARPTPVLPTKITFPQHKAASDT